ncbi:hypothetical protein [Paenibacillus pabuli]|uniref:hypothetical protein n=1 Tax=Paenibacillus pabuli TaxID=1472 RepID=UPI003CEE9437
MVNSKVKKISRFGVISVTVTMIFVCSYQVYQNVETVHNYFSPKMTSILDLNVDEWNSVKFNGNDSVKFDTVFWDKTIINDANSTGNIMMRVKDKKGNIIMDEFEVFPGTSKNLKGLNKDQQYYFEVKAENGQFIINVI